MLEASEVFTRMKNVREGLSEDQAVSRLAEVGPNIVVVSKHRGWPWRLLTAMRNPLVILLILLATISFATDDVDGGTGMTLTSFMPYTTPSGMFEDVEKHLEMLDRGLEELFEFIERVMPGDPPIEAQRLDSCRRRGGISTARKRGSRKATSSSMRWRSSSARAGSCVSRLSRVRTPVAGWWNLTHHVWRRLFKSNFQKGIGCGGGI